MSIFNLFRKNKIQTNSVRESPTLHSSEAEELGQATSSVYIPSDNELEVLQRLNGYIKGQRPGGIINAYCDNIPKLANSLIREGYLESSSYESALHSLRVTELKSILSHATLSTNGKKQELIERILLNIPEEKSGITVDRHTFYVSEKGKAAIKNYESEKREKQFLLDRQCIQLISDGKIAEAYHKLCLHIVLNPVKPGLNINWADELENGLSQRPYELSLLQDLLDFSDPETDSLLYNSKRLFNSCVIYLHLGGNNLRKVVKLFEEIKGVAFDKDLAREISLRAYYFSSIISSKKSICEFIEDGIPKFEVLCCDDSCAICKKASKAPHLCKKAELGRNLPPFHKGCSCTITPFIPD